MKLNSTQDFGMSLRYSNDMTHEQDLLRINLAYAPTKPRAMPSEINHSFPQKQVQTHNEEKSKDKKIVSSDQEVHKLPQPDPHELTKFLKTGSDVVQKHPINEEIKSWFSDLRNGILNHHQETCCFGIKGNQIRKALEFAKDRLTATFLGYLMENQQHLGGKKLNTILHDGWEFLKGYMNGWRKLNFKEVSLLRKKPNFCSFSPLFPAIEVFVNLMRLKRSNTLSYKLFQRLVIEWQTKLLN
ncbi:hypothetical protein DFH28DRAFT_978436 [Melampsora americana]|nr:hypothetical protein DFH28DRAFT_978436 [Melampsora americana]